MIFKSKEIKDKIAFLLGGYLTPDGYTYEKGKNEFVSNSGDFLSFFNMLLSSGSDHYSISVRLYISQKEIEKIYEQVLGKSHGLTMGNTIERICKSPDGKEVYNGDMSILLFQTEDVEAAIESLRGYYNDIAKSYYHQYQSLDAIDQIFNNPPFDYCPAHVGGSFEDRCIKGLIVARLVGNKKYEELVRIYNEAIKETMNIASINNYNKFREYLMYNHIK